MPGFTTRFMKNNGFAIFMSHENFGSKNWYHNATAPVSTARVTLMSDKMTQFHRIDAKLIVIKINWPGAFK